MIRWGVIGPGSSPSVSARPRQWSTGVKSSPWRPSRAADRAEAYGDRFGVPRRYDDYSALAEDDDVDAVYVATPASRHAGDTLMLLEAGKHVLCEKPFPGESRARPGKWSRWHGAGACSSWRPYGAGFFLATGTWSTSWATAGSASRFSSRLISDFAGQLDPMDRLFRLDLGGGGLLDLGIYPLQLCTLLLGPVEHVAAEGVIGETGVDEQVAAVLRHRFRLARGDQGGAPGGNELHRPDLGNRRGHRDPGLYALPQFPPGRLAFRHRGVRRVLRREWTALRDRGGAWFPGRGRDRE